MDASAEAHKNRGNDFLKEKKYAEAVAAYTSAIDLDFGNALYYSNRAAAYQALGDSKKALEDANSAIERKRDWPKGYGRKGDALCQMKRYAEAIKAYEEALTWDAGNPTYKENIALCKKEQANAPSFFSGSGLTWIVAGLHFMVLLHAILYLIPGSMSETAFYRIFKFAGACQAIHLFKSHGAPQFNKVYLQRVLQDPQGQFLFCNLISNMMSVPFFLLIVPNCCRAALNICQALISIRPAFRSTFAKLTDRPQDVHNFNAQIEVMTGIMLIIQLLTPSRNIMSLFIYWQYLRMRYMGAADSRMAFGAMGQKLDGWVGGKPLVGPIYAKLKGFLAGMVDPAQQRSGCSVM